MQMVIAATDSPSPADLQWLRQQAASGLTPRRLVERCRIILPAEEDRNNEQIAAALGITRQKAARWRARFRQSGRGGLEQDAPGRGRKPVYGPEIQKLIVERTLRTSPPAATHWSQRTLARALDVSSRTVGRVWKAHGLKPHLVRTFKVSNDPRFEEKLEDVIGLYLNAPEHALVLCCDEKSQFQALDRTQPGLPLKKGRAGDDDARLRPPRNDDLVCRLERGRRQGHRPVPRIDAVIRNAEVSPVDRRANARRARPHLILDNYANHKHPRVQKWLAKHPRFHLHFTPTSASWLNMVERFFRDLTVNRLRRGVFHSLPELVAALEKYLLQHDQEPKPFIWTAQAKDVLAKVARARKKLDQRKRSAN